MPVDRGLTLPRAECCLCRRQARREDTLASLRSRPVVLGTREVLVLDARSDLRLQSLVRAANELVSC